MMDGESRRDHFTPFLIPIGGPLRRTADGACCWPATPADSSTASRPRASTTRWSRASWPPQAILEAAPRGRRRARARGAAVTCTAGAGRSARSCATRCSSSDTCSTVPQRMDRVVRGANARPEFSRLLVDYASGRLSYRAARRRLLWHFPRLRRAWRGSRSAPAGAGERMTRAVLFDLDDTLFDHHRLGGRCAVRVHERFAPSSTFDDFERHHIALPRGDAHRGARRPGRIDEARRERFRRVFRCARPHARRGRRLTRSRRRIDRAT